MIFEEALAALRNGAKIRSPFFEPDEYLMGCYVTLMFTPYDTIEDAKARGMSILKMKGDRQHPDMGIDDFERYPKDLLTPCKHGYYPQLNLLLIMRDDWEIIE